ncbi:MAG: IS66 family insertion sequence element accessory protein TnpB [Blautia sp.]|jgi:transposase|nr:IS66 family insertion sequence element accessory protein TnpB [Blautia sp.]MDY4669432.1 IS66 family insertion sequence element accessory protein TnpB [Oliverpabstia sp.]
MLQSSRFKRIYIACGYTDLRYGIDGLAATVRERFNLNPFETDILFLFCGRRNDRIKALVWEGDGFLLLYKRLEDGKFKWPRKTEDLEEISEEQFRWLLTGLDVNPGIRKVVPPNWVL